MKLYHVSRNLNFESYFYPRIPSSIMKGEMQSIPRVCFSETIEGALTAMPCSIADNDNLDTIFFRVYEYETKDSDFIYSWEELYKNNYVPDAFITKETWVIEDISFKPEDSFIIGIYDLEISIADLIPADIYYEADKSDGDYLGLYMDKIGETIPSKLEIKEIDYIKISDDLSELEEIAEEAYRFPQEILDKSSFRPYINSLIITREDGQLISLTPNEDKLLEEMRKFQWEEVS